jgi:hypothetical protein
LAEVAGLTLPDSQLEFLVELTDQQQRARYPKDVAALGRIYTQAYAERTLTQAEEFQKWLGAKIRSAQP